MATAAAAAMALAAVTTVAAVGSAAALPMGGRQLPQGGRQLPQEGGDARAGVRRWRTLQHPGVTFPPPYRPTGAPLLVRGGGKAAVLRLRLKPDAEELATLWGRLQARPLQGHRQRLAGNFWAGFRPLLSPRDAAAIEARGGAGACDFSELVRAADAQAQAKPTEARARASAAAPVAMVDGVAQPMGAARMEGASIFLGRAATHPLSGTPKRRLRPSDVTLNLSQGARVPPGAWAGVVHNPHVDWLAAWKDTATGETKYLRLAASSAQEQGLHRAKFDAARELGRRLPAVRAAVLRDLGSSMDATQQHATCAWLIDALSIRVGSLDTVAKGVYGASTLRPEHVACSGGTSVRVRFLGKDSVPYERELRARGNCPELPAELLRGLPRVARNLAALSARAKARARARAQAEGPAGGGRLFPDLTAASLNDYLGTLAEGLTAKVLRTHHASAAFQATLAGWERRHGGKKRPGKAADDAKGQGKAAAKGQGEDKKKGDGAAGARAALALAGAHAAMLCNHRSARAAQGGPAVQAAYLALSRAVCGPDGPNRGSPEGAWGSASRAASLVRAAALLPGTTRTNYVDPRIAVAFCKRRGLPPEAAHGGRAQAERHAWAAGTPAGFRWDA